MIGVNEAAGDYDEDDMNNKMRYYVELKGYTKDDSNFYVYVVSDSIEQIELMFCEYEILCIDQTD